MSDNLVFESTKTASAAKGALAHKPEEQVCAPACSLLNGADAVLSRNHPPW
jgi:hypothetical protein